MILEKYSGPIDLKYMTYEELEKLAEEVRDYILDVTAKKRRACGTGARCGGTNNSPAKDL